MKVQPFTFTSFVEEAETAPSLLSASLDNIITEAETIPAEPAAPSFSQAELEAAIAETKEEAFIAGKQEGLREADMQKQMQLQQLKAATDSVAAQMTTIQQNFIQAVQQSHSQLPAFVMQCAQALASDALMQNPAASIEQMVNECSMALFDSPDLTVAVHPELQTAIAEKFTSKTVTINADESLKLGDCVVSWPHGEAKRDQTQIEAQVKAILDRHFSNVESDNSDSEGEKS